MKKKTANDWLDEIMSQTHTGQVDNVPEGWLTITQMCNRERVPPTTINSRVQSWLQKGLIQTKKFRIHAGRGVMSVYHYNKA